MKNYTTAYILSNDKESIRFESEKDACAYLGVVKCTVASYYRNKIPCKGYSIERIGITTHHDTGTRLFKIWGGMHERCERAKHPHYKDYGGRGISVCEEWKEYLPFKEWAIKNGYDENLTIDRIDNNGNYCPTNCRWVTQTVQHNNKRSNRVVEYDGTTYTLAMLSRKFGIKNTTLKERLNAGWSVKDAVEKPIRERTRGYRPSCAKMKGENDEADC